MISEVLVYAGIVWLTVLLAVSVVLVARAQTPARRILALDMLILVLIGELVLFADLNEASFFLDTALILALLSFVASLAAAQYVERGRLF